MEELTVKRVRQAAEKAINLEEGFYKTQGNWKSRSEEIIKDQVESEENEAPESAPEEDAASASEDVEPAKPSKPAKRSKPTKPAASRKKRKTSASESEDGDAGAEELNGDDEEEEEEEIKKPAKEPSPKTSEDYVQDDSEAEGEEAKSEEKPDETPKDDSESEMSVVLDEEPKPKPTRKRQKSSEAPARKAKKPAPAKGAAKAKDADTDPNQAEIKRLQGWLVKCGIRKMWFRELAPYDTSKAKIKHLKDMLKDVGMEGRYSADKANRIREERELKADLELVQEGAKRWGKGSASEQDNSDDNAPKRRLNRGRKSLAFLESEGEETD
ncbi:hypothetical protein BO70DRAFT_357806 [Aspergillus heteromorphus CBS 117.55]|uniref:Transcriptional regulator n=1 Tax=Aspergillus heteromorphus CBS 117.55 TaxID=1448321 RepID=A0A317X4X8_9EURO|nr:uncharacterized protein BO70DRAFT_357806 [Aspergillus heteromorphus CBS 117.55]PWY92662.1 hypothetical protein BO70DRAFT_357806 [Aspergillus heteromorphus CBS 117.55]